ncbi:hypothetical protein C8R43DRAFT_1208649 [Mycena crocata]|nr:hypothetical protein C8R43DRAFT_1208649 [Mycena crocata]
MFRSRVSLRPWPRVNDLGKPKNRFHGARNENEGPCTHVEAPLSRVCCSLPFVQRATRAKFTVDKADLALTRLAAPDFPLDWPNAAPATANLNVHWHVVYAHETYEGGFLFDEQIAFAPLTFTLINTTRTLDEAKFLYVRDKVSTVRTELVTQLHIGTELDINTYSLNFTFVPGLRGFSSFPFEYKNATVDDGIMIKWNSLPGGRLWHTWQDDCFFEGDEADNTPAEDPINAGRGSQTCPASFDSCPDLPGKDLIHN